MQITLGVNDLYKRAYRVLVPKTTQAQCSENPAGGFIRVKHAAEEDRNGFLLRGSHGVDNPEAQTIGSIWIGGESGKAAKRFCSPARFLRCVTQPSPSEQDTAF